MALSGDLKDFGLLQLLTLVQVTHKGGGLTVQRPGDVATLYFDNGQLVKVKSQSRSEGLATLLFRAGRIDREQYDAITSQAPPSEQAVGLLLVDQGSLTQEEIVKFVREKSLVDLYSLLTWSEGTFRFEVDMNPPEEDILAPSDLAPVLEKGRSYQEEWQLLVSYIPSLDQPLRLLSEPRQQLSEVCLSLAEWRMVASLNGGTPLKEVAQRLALDEFGVRQVAYRLVSAGLADVAVPEFVPPPPTKESWEPKEAEESKPSALSRLFGRK